MALGVEAERAVAERAAEVLVPQLEFAEIVGLPAIDAVKHAAVARRLAGRPPGARNKRAELLAKEVIARFGDPIVKGLALVTMDADELAARAGCSVLEAIQEQRLWLSVVLPFTHQRQPLAVVHQGQVVHLTIGDVNVAGGASASVEVVTIQEVSGASDGAV